MQFPTMLHSTVVHALSEKTSSYNSHFSTLCKSLSFLDLFETGRKMASLLAELLGGGASQYKLTNESRQLGEVAVLNAGQNTFFLVLHSRITE